MFALQGAQECDTSATKTTWTGDYPSETATTTKTVGNIYIKDLPEFFESFDINKYKQPVTTTKKEEIRVEQKNVESPDNKILFSKNNKVNIMTKD